MAVNWLRFLYRPLDELRHYRIESSRLIKEMEAALGGRRVIERLDRATSEKEINDIIRQEFLGEKILDRAYFANWIRRLFSNIQEERKARRQVFQFSSRGMGQAAGEVAGSLRLEIDQRFVDTLLAYQREMRMGLAEVVVKRTANILKIVSQHLPKNQSLRSKIRKAAKARVELYESDVSIEGKRAFRLGAWLLMQARLEGKHEERAKKFLPKPTPKLPLHKTKTGKKRKRKGVAVNFHGQLADYTTRFIAMAGDEQKRMNQAVQWYRFGLARAMEGVLKTAGSGVGGVQVDRRSKGFQDAQKVWRVIIKQTKFVKEGKRRKNQLGFGYGVIRGTPARPEVLVGFKGKVAKELFPDMFRRAMQLDREDMAKHLDRRMKKAVRRLGIK